MFIAIFFGCSWIRKQAVYQFPVRLKERPSRPASIKSPLHLYSLYCTVQYPSDKLQDFKKKKKINNSISDGPSHMAKRVKAITKLGFNTRVNPTELLDKSGSWVPKGIWWCGRGLRKPASSCRRKSCDGQNF